MMTQTNSYVVISGKPYLLHRSDKGLLMFSFQNNWVVYEKDRDGAPLDKAVIAREYPEWLV